MDLILKCDSFSVFNERVGRKIEFSTFGRETNNKRQDGKRNTFTDSVIPKASISSAQTESKRKNHLNIMVGTALRVAGCAGG